jgi:hypothetical protein
VHKGKAQQDFSCQDIHGWALGSRLYVSNFHDAFRKRMDIFILVNAPLQEAISDP